MTEPRLIRQTVLNNEIVSTFKLGGSHQYVTTLEDLSGRRAPTINYYFARAEAVHPHERCGREIKESDNTSKKAPALQAGVKDDLEICTTRQPMRSPHG